MNSTIPTSLKKNFSNTKNLPKQFGKSYKAATSYKKKEPKVQKVVEGQHEQGYENDHADRKPPAPEVEQYPNFEKLVGSMNGFPCRSPEEYQQRQFEFKYFERGFSQTFDTENQRENEEPISETMARENQKLSYEISDFAKQQIMAPLRTNFYEHAQLEQVTVLSSDEEKQNSVN